MDDIITELSRFSELFVIARNSSFQYKGKAIDVRQVGRELGVRCVLEGSVRRGRDRIRISAQLVDTATGSHRWAERYDRSLEEHRTTDQWDELSSPHSRPQSMMMGTDYQMIWRRAQLLRGEPLPLRRAATAFGWPAG